MINLKEACRLVLSKHPGEYIHVVNEYENAYEFILLNKDEEPDEFISILCATVINKQTGQIKDSLLGMDPTCQGRYKQYAKEELEGM